jgi:hypothetical protein
MAIHEENTAGKDSFWLNWAAETIYYSGDKREVSVKTLITVITWTFGLFAAGTGGLLSIFGGVREFNPLALLSFGVAFFFLSLAYFFAHRALFPIAKSFRPAEVAGIKAGFSEVVIKQTKRFRFAAGFTATGFFFLATAIFLQFWSVSKEKEKSAQKYSYAVSAAVEKRGDTIFVPITATGKPLQPVQLNIYKTSHPDSIGSTKSKSLESKIFRSDNTGRFYFSYPVNPMDSVKIMVMQVVFREKGTADSLEEISKAIRVIINK